jgi:hypothetical protein
VTGRHEGEQGAEHSEDSLAGDVGDSLKSNLPPWFRLLVQLGAAERDCMELVGGHSDGCAGCWPRGKLRMIVDSMQVHLCSDPDTVSNGDRRLRVVHFEIR